MSILKILIKDLTKYVISLIS